MIEEPPLLTIKAATGRPTPEQVAALAKHPTGVLCDAMGGQGALPRSIKPLAPGRLAQKAAGVALTVSPGPRDILALIAALTEVEAGDVIVMATGGWEDSAAFGDRVCGMARNGGAAAIVSDGPARDLDGIVAAGLPAFCAGLSPNSPYGNGPGAVGVPVVIGAVSISRGDVVVADADGVAIVPFARVDEIIARADATAELEAELDAKVAEGLSAPDAIRELVASDKVRRI